MHEQYHQNAQSHCVRLSTFRGQTCLHEKPMMSTEAGMACVLKFPYSAAIALCRQYIISACVVRSFPAQSAGLHLGGGRLHRQAVSTMLWWGKGRDAPC